MTSNKVIKKSAKKTRDSEKTITRKTKVVDYKNDAATRSFFVKQIGRRFHFTNYLRQFTNKNNLANKKLTYGDLVEGWLAEESRKKSPNYKTSIGKQFKYNQFIRDFFLHEKGKTLADAIKAWKMVKVA
ncbi:MAG: hypothetical protein ACD_46C00199G0003 [uncultured bacterium]|nr:MAG: hypothetical protein ACD_46C00199G0003 [uncultured bacterium]OGT08755.1 MAG: hypothetical protein A2V89_00150 [Gammaproteobacteria bacterium RBG_16_37_9]HBC71180.1 hypothetical protein [Coxiellaceae bacterium]HBY56229.1 hypothetical protein [Coxiellaceae bacterium]